MEDAVAARWIGEVEPRTLRMLGRLGAILALAAVGLAGLWVYESRTLGLWPMDEMAPIFDPYHLLRSGFALLLSALIVATIYAGRADDSGLERRGLPTLGGAAALTILAMAVAATALFLVDVRSFSRGALEDSPIEWVSALALLAGSGLFLRSFTLRLRARRRGEEGGGWLGMALALGFAGVLFLIGMEEISWLQRVFDFQTPAELAKINTQHEFNLHNLNTDISEIVYYVGAGPFLILLPLLAEALPAGISIGGVEDFLPSRWVAAASAPLSMFNYGQWNFIPIQMTMMLTVLVMLVYAHSAARRAGRGEAALFAMLAVAVTAAQAIFLARGDTVTNIWDASEYKELFIAIGLASFALDVALRSRARTPVTA